MMAHLDHGLRCNPLTMFWGVGAEWLIILHCDWYGFGKCHDLRKLRVGFCLLKELKHDWFNTLRFPTHPVLLPVDMPSQPEQSCTVSSATAPYQKHALLHSFTHNSNTTKRSADSFKCTIFPRHLRPVNCWNYQAWIDRLVLSVRELSLETTGPAEAPRSETEVMPVPWSKCGCSGLIYYRNIEDRYTMIYL